MKLWALVLLVTLPGGDDPVRVTILNSFEHPWYATESECRAMEPAVYDHVMVEPGVTMEVVCEPRFPFPRFKPSEVPG